MVLEKEGVGIANWLHGNGFFDRVPNHEQAALEPYIEKVDLRTGEILYQPGDPLTHIYFPLSGIMSVIAVMKDGRAVETMAIGREGVVATSASSYLDPAFSRFMVQMPGAAARQPPKGSRT